MCGIAGIYIRRPQNLNHVDLSLASRELLFAIDSRGGDACGYLAIDFDGVMQEQKAACSALEFEKEMKDMPRNLRTLLMHTRFATQGSKAFPENNHPVRSGPIRLIHNGHISNDDDFFGDTGIRRLGRVDSEAIAAAINKAGWENAKEALEQLDGSFAIAAISEDHPDQLLLAKGSSSPLCVAFRPSFVMWASTMTALQYTWKTCVGTSPNSKHLEFFTEGQMALITPDGITRSEFTPKRTTRYTSYRYGDWDDDYAFGRGWNTSGDRAGTYTYWMNGQKIEYDRATGTERVVEDVRQDLYNRPVDAKDHPLRSWVANHLMGGQRQLTAGKPFCAECGTDTIEELQDVSGTWYCADCLDFLCDLAAEDCMPGENFSIYDREQADSESIHRSVQRGGTNDNMVVVTHNPDDYVRCPDCFDYFHIKDMVEDKGELICQDCEKIQQELFTSGMR